MREGFWAFERAAPGPSNLSLPMVLNWRTAIGLAIWAQHPQPFGMATKTGTVSRDISNLAVALTLRATAMLQERRSLVAGKSPPQSQIPFEPSWLLHYTSDSTALKILRGGPRICDATTSNDRTEYQHGAQIMYWALQRTWELSLEDLQALYSSIDDPLTAKRLTKINRIGEYLRKAIRDFDKITGLALCLSQPLRDLGPAQAELSDILAMWREYGGDGAGVALVVCAPDLSGMINGQTSGVFEVYYDDEEKRILSRYLAVATEELIANRSRSSWTKDIADVNRKLTRGEILLASRIAAGFLCLLFKDSCWSYERETRLLYLHMNGHLPGLKRFKNSKTKRFRKYLQWPQVAPAKATFPIAAVHFGPRAVETPEQKQIISVCRERNIPVVESKLPYRGGSVPDEEWQQSIKRLVRLDRRIHRKRKETDGPSLKVQISSHLKSLEEEARLWNQKHLKGRRK